MDGCVEITGISRVRRNKLKTQLSQCIPEYLVQSTNAVSSDISLASEVESNHHQERAACRGCHRAASLDACFSALYSSVFVFNNAIAALFTSTLATLVGLHARNLIQRHCKNGDGWQRSPPSRGCCSSVEQQRPSSSPSVEECTSFFASSGCHKPSTCYYRRRTSNSKGRHSSSMLQR